MVWLSSGQIFTLLSLLHASTLESVCNEGVLNLNVLREALNRVTSDQVIIVDLIGCLHTAGVI
jgi:hypothetical protein